MSVHQFQQWITEYTHIHVQVMHIIYNKQKGAAIQAENWTKYFIGICLAH